MRARKVAAYSASGPGADRGGFPSAAAATAWAQGQALSIKGKTEATYYVRDVAGVVLHRIERTRDGVIETHTIRKED